MIGGEHSEEQYQTLFVMSGIENILTHGDLRQYNETNTASEVS